MILKMKNWKVSIIMMLAVASIVNQTLSADIYAGNGKLINGYRIYGVNQIFNPNFDPQVTSSTTREIEGWGNVTIGPAYGFNAYWNNNNQVIKFSGKLSQTISLRKGFYLLWFDVATISQPHFMRILLNDIQVYRVYLQDRTPVHRQLIIFGAEGPNTLSFKGYSSRTGQLLAMIGNIGLYETDQLNGQLSPPIMPNFETFFGTNYVINGKFALPTADRMEATVIPGWIGSFYIGDSQKLNSQWKTEQAVQLSRFIYQRISLLPQYYLLRIYYAANELQPLSVSQMKIQWNQQQLSSIKTTNFKIGMQDMMVTAISGQNEVNLTSTGSRKQNGITISNVGVYLARQVPGLQVQVFEPYRDQYNNKLLNPRGPNLIANSDFKEPQVQIFKYFQEITGWKGNLEVGKGHYYNSRWGLQQIVDLDVVPKTVIYQKLELKKGFYVLKYLYAVSQNFIYSCQMESAWNNEQLRHHVGEDNQIHQEEMTVIAQELNYLEFRGLGKSDGIGMTISRITLHQK